MASIRSAMNFSVSENASSRTLSVNSWKSSVSPTRKRASRMAVRTVASSIPRSRVSSMVRVAQPTVSPPSHSHICRRPVMAST